MNVTTNRPMMTRKEAVAVLKKHNEWRRGDDDINMQTPTIIGIAIDTIIAPQWISAREENPTEAGYYFVKGKGGRKAIMEFLAGGWFIADLATNHFNVSEIQWFKG